MRLSHLLISQGVCQDQVAAWRQDGLWLARFLKRLEGKLLAILVERLPSHDPRALTRRYSLDGKGTRSADGVATELGITTTEAHLAHDLFLRYLRREAGQMAFEEAVLAAAEETERIRQSND